jgi:hypothetical protein
MDIQKLLLSFTEKIRMTWSEHLKAFVSFLVGPAEVDHTPLSIDIYMES